MHDELKPQMPVDDSESRMARADLYRAAKNSMKLFEMIHDGQELEGWVSAKITKAADYLDSVYHYMEYQVKFGQGGTATSLDDITSDATMKVQGEVSEEDDEQEMKESYKQKLQALLEGAKKKAKPDFLDMDKDGNKKEPMKKAVSDKKKGAVKEAKKDEALDMNLLKAAQKHAKDNPSKKDPESERNVHKKYGYRTDKSTDSDDDYDEWGNKKQAKKGSKVKEGSTGDYSAKKARAGKDIGKPGKNFAKIAKKAEKGGAKSGEAVAGAVLKKLRAKEDVQVEAKKAKPDFLDMDKDGNKKEPMKKAVADKKAVKESAELTDILKLAGRKPING